MPELGDAAQDAAAATAAVADIADPSATLLTVCTGPTCSVVLQQRKRLGPGEISRLGGPSRPEKVRQTLSRVGARLAELVLLEPADALVDREGLLLEEQGPHVVIRQDRLGLDGARRGDHPVQGRPRLHDPLGAAPGEVVLHQVGQVLVHRRRGLRLVEADHEGRQPEAGPPILPVQPDQAATDQLEQRPADLPDRLAGRAAIASTGSGVTVRSPARAASRGEQSFSRIRTSTPDTVRGYPLGSRSRASARRSKGSLPISSDLPPPCCTWMAVTMTAPGRAWREANGPGPATTLPDLAWAVIGSGQARSAVAFERRSGAAEHDVDTREHRPRFAADRRPARSVRSSRSSVTSCDTFATESLAARWPARKGARCREHPPSAGCWSGHADDRAQRAAVERLTLDHDDRPPEPGLRPGRLAEVGPPDLALGDHHSVEPRVRRAAAPANRSSPGSPISATTGRGPP